MAINRLAQVQHRLDAAVQANLQPFAVGGTKLGAPGCQSLGGWQSEAVIRLARAWISHLDDAAHAALPGWLVSLFGASMRQKHPSGKAAARLRAEIEKLSAFASNQQRARYKPVGYTAVTTELSHA
jgi:hypothetical protein